MIMFCSQCGKKNPDNINYCQYCGTPVICAFPSPAPKVDERLIETAVLNPSVPVEKNGKKGLAIAGLILSCVGLGISVICCIFGGMMMGIPLCVAGIILSAVNMKCDSSKAVALSGLIIGIVGVVIGFLMMICFFAALEGNSEIVYYFEEFIEEILGY